MKLAIMQPYLFPYIGYFQLINAADTFVFYDDVSYIKQGWINRNYILTNNKKHLFTFPVEKASSFKKINEVKIETNSFQKTKSKLLKTIEQSYKAAPFFSPVMNIIYETFTIRSEFISDYAKKSVIEVCNYLKIKTSINLSSAVFTNDHLKSTSRIIDICLKENSKQYINPIGGKVLYDKEHFRKFGTDLFFLKSKEIKYNQFVGNFISNLSIIDMLMFNKKETVNDFLCQIELI